MSKIRVLFVCLGNICRSPAAEGIFLKKIDAKNFNRNFQVDSAGTGNWHVGQLPDARMRQVSLTRGYELTSRARQFTAEDFENFDLIVAMDNSNYANICKLSNNPEHLKKVTMMTSYCLKHKLTEVPDPYFGGEQGFHHVIDILEDATESLLSSLIIKHKLEG
ncbi:MAG: low molecular weight phosphotyrosine protein phosphatase [Bacteriovoracaceae bacterium]|nr:low molecular weight phosphotyrosine protein phosphatase [Bacteriovoracaceae bacterium]